MRSIFTSLIVAVMLTSGAVAGPLEGIGKAKDGDSIIVGDTEIRLAGIDAPEADQLCQNSFGQSYPCGTKATVALQDILSKGKLYCQTRGVDVDVYGRPLAECWILGKGGSMTNVNEVMVRAGMAFAFTKYSEEYTELEALAERQKAGLWAGKFEFPWAYREGQRPTQPPQGQPIPMPREAANCPPVRPYCKSVRSCERACFLFQQCGYGALDRDNDGIPCENVCRKKCPPIKKG